MIVFLVVTATSIWSQVAKTLRRFCICGWGWRAPWYCDFSRTDK